MFRLIFRILADATGFNRTLKTEMPATAKQGGKLAGKAAGDEVGKQVGAQIKAGIMRYLGAGALLGAVKKFSEEASEIVKGAMAAGLSTDAYQELQAAMKQTGLSMEELQKSAALAPAEFTRLMETIRANGGIIPQDAIDGLRKTKELMDGMKADSMAGIFKVLDALRQAWYGLHAGLGATYQAVGMQTGNNALFARGVRFTQYANEGAEKMVGMASVESDVAGNSFVDAAKRRAAERDSLVKVRTSDQLTQMNESFGFGNSKTRDAMGSVPFMGQIVEELKKANDKLQALNNTTKTKL